MKLHGIYLIDDKGGSTNHPYDFQFFNNRHKFWKTQFTYLTLTWLISPVPSYTFLANLEFLLSTLLGFFLVIFPRSPVKLIRSLAQGLFAILDPFWPTTHPLDSSFTSRWHSEKLLFLIWWSLLLIFLVQSDSLSLDFLVRLAASLIPTLTLSPRLVEDFFRGFIDFNTIFSSYEDHKKSLPLTLVYKHFSYVFLTTVLLPAVKLHSDPHKFQCFFVYESPDLLYYFSELIKMKTIIWLARLVLGSFAHLVAQNLG